ncbi:MAG: RtcB family protein [Candidatus Aenigmatarchaeota archaeon]
MITISSENIPVKMWLDKIEPETEKQARNLANLSVAFHHIAVMPDAHVGYGMPIGGVLATIDAVVPNAVGVDIGCGMVAAKSSLKEISENVLKKILGELRKKIPVGFEHHRKPQPWEGFDRAPDVPIIQQELSSAKKQIGTLGGGNHFLEILQEVEDKRWGLKGEGNIWLMLHSGSRNFGLKVANFYHGKAQIFCERNSVALPGPDLAFLSLDSQEGKEYWQAMKYCLDFARANRGLMIKRFMEIFSDVTGSEFINFNKEHNPESKKQEAYIGIHHNYAAREEHFGQEVIVHRKGATAAFAGQLGIVPGSMGTPSFIVEGLGSPESFKSCSHGAGRQMSRREANKKISEKEAEEAIAGVLFGRWHGKFDEAPQAYKNIEEVMEQQKDLARPIVKLKPLAVIIGG